VHFKVWGWGFDLFPEKNKSVRMYQALPLSDRRLSAAVQLLLLHPVSVTQGHRGCADGTQPACCFSVSALHSLHSADNHVLLSGSNIGRFLLYRVVQVCFKGGLIWQSWWHCLKGNSGILKPFYGMKYVYIYSPRAVWWKSASFGRYLDSSRSI